MGEPVKHARRLDRSKVLYAFGWVLLVIGGTIYVNQVTDATIDCIYRAQVQAGEVSDVTRDAAERRDDALRRSKLTMGRIVELRIGDRETDSPELRDWFERYLPVALSDYMDTKALSIRYVESVIDYAVAQHDLDSTRDDNPVPDVRKMCQ